MDFIFFKKKDKFLFAAALTLILFFLSNFASAAERRIALNYEAIRIRLLVERYIEIISALRDTLQFCESVFPIQTQAEIQQNVGMDAWSVYEQMLSMEDSSEVFNFYLEFLSKNERLREILQKTFVPADPGKQSNQGKQKPAFSFGSAEASIGWLWLYPTRDGLKVTAQEDMTEAESERIFGTGGVRCIFELRFPLPDGVTKVAKNPFWEKGAARIFKSLPGARVEEVEGESLELVYEVFPNVSGIPAIIQRTLEMTD